jgi:hypothetical protein
MPYYSLRIVEEHKTLSTPARDRSEALAILGKELGIDLSLDEDSETVAAYLLDEWWNDGPHWVNPTIPVYAVSTR